MSFIRKVRKNNSGKATIIVLDNLKSHSYLNNFCRHMDDMRNHYKGGLLSPY